MQTFRRHITDEIENHIYSDEVTIVTGSRQVGKTTLLQSIQQELISKGFTTFYITLERIDLRSLLDENPENIFSIIPPVGSKRAIVFIDEIQYLKNPTNFLKLLYDEYKGKLKLVVTGSSAFYIDRKFKDSLSGRKRIFHLYPFSFKEMIDSREGSELLLYLQRGLKQEKKIPVIYQDKLSKAAEEYAVFGGYPKVVLTDDYKEKQIILHELASSFLKKDALESNIRKEAEFMLFVEVLADRTGNKLNRQELGNLCNISDETARNFIYILQKSFHIFLVRPFWKSKTSELRKMPKFYFQDNGMRNAILHDFTPITTRKDKGDLAENMAFNLLRHHYEPERIQYWSTRELKEVDFILNKEKAIEIKYSDTSIRKNKYKLFHETYPDIEFQFACFKATHEHLQLWSI